MNNLTKMIIAIGVTILALFIVYVIVSSDEYSNEMETNPSISIDATIIHLTKDVDEIDKYPYDTGIIKIDSINSIDNPDNFDISDIVVGNQIEVEFIYTANKSEIIEKPEIVIPTTDNESVVYKAIHMYVSYDNVTGYTFVIENSLISSERSTVLPGLDVGSKISCVINYGVPSHADGVYETKTNSIGKYTVI